MVNSPFGRVLQAIRENPFRAEALGYRTVIHRTLANCIAAAVAAAVGALNALWLRYTGPDTSLSFNIMLDILLIVVIGGMGTMYGAIIGGTLYVLAQNYLQALMGTVSTAAGDAGIAAAAEPVSSRPLAALARHPVHRQRLFLSRPASSASCAETPVNRAITARTPSITNCTASAASSTPSRRESTVLPVTPSSRSMRPAERETRKAQRHDRGDDRR